MLSGICEFPSSYPTLGCFQAILRMRIPLDEQPNPSLVQQTQQKYRKLPCANLLSSQSQSVNRLLTQEVFGDERQLTITLIVQTKVMNQNHSIAHLTLQRALLDLFGS